LPNQLGRDDGIVNREPTLLHFRVAFWTIHKRGQVFRRLPSHSWFISKAAVKKPKLLLFQTDEPAPQTNDTNYAANDQNKQLSVVGKMRTTEHDTGGGEYDDGCADMFHKGVVCKWPD
jgi:hypothetical protein